jgi:hypothetical protein
MSKYMKNMRNLAILAVFILGSLSVFGQSEQNDTILVKTNHKSTVYTPVGVYITTSADISVGTDFRITKKTTYLYVKNEMTHVPSLDDCVILGYSKEKNCFVVGVAVGGRGVLTHLYQYNLATKTKVLLANYNNGIYSVELDGNAVTAKVGGNYTLKKTTLK